MFLCDPESKTDGKKVLAAVPETIKVEPEKMYPTI